jgi:hypothetical protein
MTTHKLSRQFPSALVLVDAGSPRRILHKLAVRFWLHPGYFGDLIGSVMS